MERRAFRSPSILRWIRGLMDCCFAVSDRVEQLVAETAASLAAPKRVPLGGGCRRHAAEHEWLSRR